MTRSAITWGVSLIALGLPGVAMACPACARNFSGPMAYAMVASLIGLPYVVSMVVIRVIRTAEAEDPTSGSGDHSP